MNWKIETIQIAVGVVATIVTTFIAMWKTFLGKVARRWYDHFKAKRDQQYIMLDYKIGKIMEQLHPDGGTSLRDDIVETKMMVQDLRVVQRNNGELLGACTWEADANGKWVYVSANLCELFGCLPAHLLNFGWVERIEEKDRERVFHLYIKSLERGTFFEEEFNIRKCNAIDLFKVSANAIHNKNKGAIYSSQGRIIKL